MNRVAFLFCNFFKNEPLNPIKLAGLVNLEFGLMKFMRNSPNVGWGIAGQGADASIYQHIPS